MNAAEWLGVVIAQSLVDPEAPSPWTVVATRPLGGWEFRLVRIAEPDLQDAVHRLRAGMVTDDAWYLHLFRGEELLVVFRDAAFAVTTDPATWAPAVAHGLAAGIPREQLDFHPRTAEAARAFFALDTGDGAR